MLVGLGAMKSGTTWLSQYLGNHPSFLHSPVNEMNFFNQLWDNPYRGRKERYRLFRMEEIILSKASMRSRRHLDQLKGFAQVGRLATVEDYLGYFEERIRSETHFGEISPSYSHLPADALKTIATITADVRFIFIMREPTQRAASHIRHLRRRVKADSSVDELVREVDASNTVYMRSNYGTTLDAIEQAGLGDRAHLIFFEEMFKAETIAGLCKWLGIRFMPIQPDRKANAGRGEDVSEQQLDELRDRLEPIYADLQRRGFESRAPTWRWGRRAA